MHYFIDGYNLMFRLGMTGASLRSERERFILNLYEKIQTIGLDATIVFDAQNQTGLGSRNYIGSLEICFTDQGETADDYIINELASTPNPRQEIIVTSDRNLALRARGQHAKSEPVEEFIKWLDHSYKRKKKQTPAQFTPVQQGAGSIPKEVLDPILEANIQKDINEYLEVFEKKIRKLSSSEKEATKKIRSQQPRENDMERWLRIFEEKLSDRGD